MLNTLAHNILREIGGIEQYGIASLCLFSSIFAGVLIFALCQKRNHLDHMSRVPLEEGYVPAATQRGCLSRSGAAVGQPESTEDDHSPAQKDSHE